MDIDKFAKSKSDNKWVQSVIVSLYKLNPYIVLSGVGILWIVLIIVRLLS